MISTVDFDNNIIEWSCAVCGTALSAKLSDLCVGGRLDHVDDPYGNPDIIYLPPCSSCPKRTEGMLFRTKEETGERMRQVINAVFAHVRTHGAVHPTAVAVYQSEDSAGTGPVSLASTSGRHDDVSGEVALAEARAKAEAESAAEMAALREQIAKQLEDEAEAQGRRRLILAAAAAINKREGRPPGSKPTLEEINAELAGDVSADDVPAEILAGAEQPAIVDGG